MAKGLVIESRLDKGRGPVASMCSCSPAPFTAATLCWPALNSVVSVP